MALIKFISMIEKAFDELSGNDLLHHPELSMMSQGFTMLVKNVVPEESKFKE